MAQHTISPELLSTLICPETHQPVHEGDAALTKKVIALQRSGKLTSAHGPAHDGEIQGVLVREDGKVGYPIIDGLAMMLIDEAIDLSELG